MENMFKIEFLDSFREFGPGPILVCPCLGKPTILSLTSEQRQAKDSIGVELLAVAESDLSLKQIQDFIQSNLFITPLLGLDSKSRRAILGKSIKLEDIICSRADPTPLGTTSNFVNPDESNRKSKQINPHIEPLHYHKDLAQSFADKNQGIRIQAKFKISRDMKDYLNTHQFIICDLVQELPSQVHAPHPIRLGEPSNRRVLPHAFCFSNKQDWDSLNFIHVTDLHIAKRNDDILGVILKDLKETPHEKIADAIKQVGNVLKPSFKQISSKLKQVGKTIKDESIKLVNKIDPQIISMLSFKTAPDFDPKSDYFPPEEAQINPEIEAARSKIPLVERFHNPNNNLRRFIRQANLLADQNQLDFVVMTGDLIDFALITDHPDPTPIFDLDRTNWTRFLDIILNRPISPRDGYTLEKISEGEELLVPIFTGLGNHDYRVGSYSLISLGNHKHYGLRVPEAIAYKDPNPSPSSLIPSHLSIRNYAQYVNPFENFYFCLGKHTFIMLNSGYDSILKPQYLLMGDPSLTGFSEEQLRYLKLIQQYIIDSSGKGKSFLMSHAPILNPVIRQAFQVGLLQKVRLLPNFEINDMKETKLREFGEKNTRSDLDLDYQCGVISSNWIETLQWLEETKSIALNGHTHYLREFRTAPINNPLGEDQSSNPIAIYWDDYSQIFKKTPSKFEENLPLHLQTPSLALPNEKTGIHAGGYRTIKIHQNRLESLEVSFIDN